MTTVIEKKSFQEAVEDTDAVTVDEFFDELDDNIRKRFDQDIILQDGSYICVDEVISINSFSISCCDYNTHN